MLNFQGRFKELWDYNMYVPSPKTRTNSWRKPNLNHNIHLLWCWGQLVYEHIGLENGIVLSFSSHHGFVGDRESDVVWVAGSLVWRFQPC